LVVDECEWSDCCTGKFIAREKAEVGGWVGAGAGLDVLQMRWFSCSCRDLNCGSCSVYGSHCTQCAAPYWFEENAKVCINKLRWEVWIGCFCFMIGIPGRLF